MLEDPSGRRGEATCVCSGATVVPHCGFSVLPGRLIVYWKNSNNWPRNDTCKQHKSRKWRYAMNKFEQTILKTAKAAQKFHLKMTYGSYLWYSHESFLQNYIAIHMFKETKRCIYVDPSPKKLRESSENAGRKPPKQLKQRFDLVFWMKESDRVKAILEVKVSWGKKPIIDDIEKVSEYIEKYENGATGYVLYYTDKKRKPKCKGKDAVVIENRFHRVREAQEVELVGSYICDPRDTDPWGFALYRCR